MKKILALGLIFNLAGNAFATNELIIVPKELSDYKVNKITLKTDRAGQLDMTCEDVDTVESLNFTFCSYAIEQSGKDAHYKTNAKIVLQLSKEDETFELFFPVKPKYSWRSSDGARLYGGCRFLLK